MHAVRVVWFGRYCSLRGWARFSLNSVGIEHASFVSSNEMYPTLALRYDASFSLGIFFFFFLQKVQARVGKGKSSFRLGWLRIRYDYGTLNIMCALL